MIKGIERRGEGRKGSSYCTLKSKGFYASCLEEQIYICPEESLEKTTFKYGNEPGFFLNKIKHGSCSQLYYPAIKLMQSDLQF